MISDHKISTEEKPKTPAEPKTESESGTNDTDIEQAPKPDPTRYGDWEKGGRCIDF